MALDRDKLLAWLDRRAKSTGLVAGAVYAGLAERIRRGDYDDGEED